ncbi:unnamed protein product [Leptidea sinapis]|uniref:Uncharacterized protein n=1 Tax=Leptidea sinapis TaxID=189913 RepID=A0A5E4QHI8_9NEOP|nr:unnamed protein product [Leptidea sinapis]
MRHSFSEADRHAGGACQFVPQLIEVTITCLLHFAQESQILCGITFMARYNAEENHEKRKMDETRNTNKLMGKRKMPYPIGYHIHDTAEPTMSKNILIQYQVGQDRDVIVGESNVNPQHNMTIRTGCFSCVLLLRGGSGSVGEESTREDGCKISYINGEDYY